MLLASAIFEASFISFSRVFFFGVILLFGVDDDAAFFGIGDSRGAPESCELTGMGSGDLSGSSSVASLAS